MIAWVLYKIPEKTFKGETVEEWIDLNGKQGDGKEGQICIVTSFTVSIDNCNDVQTSYSNVFIFSH